EGILGERFGKAREPRHVEPRNIAGIARRAGEQTGIALPPSDASRTPAGSKSPHPTLDGVGEDCLRYSSTPLLSTGGAQARSGGIGRRARFRTWFPFREWRFESSLRHLDTKGLAAMSRESFSLAPTC